MRWTDFLRMVDPPFLRMIIPVHKMGRNHRIKSFNFRQTYNIKWIQVAEIYPMKYPQLSHSVRCRNRHAWGLKNHSSKVPWTPQLEPILAGPGPAMIIPLKVTASTNRKKYGKMWKCDLGTSPNNVTHKDIRKIGRILHNTMAKFRSADHGNQPQQGSSNRGLKWAKSSSWSFLDTINPTRKLAVKLHRPIQCGICFQCFIPTLNIP